MRRIIVLWKGSSDFVKYVCKASVSILLQQRTYKFNVVPTTICLKKLKSTKTLPAISLALAISFKAMDRSEESKGDPANKLEDLRGRIVVYSIIGCPHCLAAKQTLREAHLPFVDVSVDRFPESTGLRSWLKTATGGKTSVPQIFFNKQYVGGNRELQDIISSADQEKWNSLLQEVRENDPPSEQDADAPLLPHPSEALDDTIDKLSDVTCEPNEMLVLARQLREAGIVKDRVPKGTSCVGIGSRSWFGIFQPKASVHDAFYGSEFVDWAMKEKGFENREDAVKLGTKLLSSDKEDISVCSTSLADHTIFEDKPDKLYKLPQSLHESKNKFNRNVLNMDIVNECAPLPAPKLGEDLRRLILALHAKFLSSDGRSVDYDGIKGSKMFESYKGVARQLQRVDLDSMAQNRNELLAFFINIYNALVIHGTIERGVPANLWARYSFFSTTAYNIGGYKFTLNDIENGILRGNRASMATLYMRPFAASVEKDPRLKFTVKDPVEARIHFALNCGAKSCPPIKTFSSEGLEEQLAAATEAYLESEEDAVRISMPETTGEKVPTIHLSMLFKWYAEDFGSNKKDILEWIHQNMAGDNTDVSRKQQIAKLIGEKDIESIDYKIKYIPYDWGNNAKKK